ncbi:T9SS sorting signal type C domain-containing protein [Flavobacterium sp. ACN6]|uniref:T9SS sorting signal type C domain-containing protein n=1 Tax=Flavobacterium sp. ACN6 TaxID=1920426 RepID=UPI000BB3E3A3|nr:T9SS sorting signal type C domain-containing protein [Flavobacterium sp. ACN6]PBJ15921.1 hypothetical protein BSF42_03250 [Flavobacterium sp. ACN6]
MKKILLSSLLLFPIHAVVQANTISTYCADNTRAIAFRNIEVDSLAKPTSTFEIERHRVWLNLTNTNGVFKQILIAYVTGATNGWDQNYDAVTMDAYKPADFYSINERKRLVIQGRALPFDPYDAVPLGYRTSTSGDMTIAIDHADGDLINQNIYLHDKETGAIHNLKNGGYTFSTMIGVFADRFVITYSADGKLGVDDFKNIKQNLIVSSKDKTIRLKSDQAALKEVSVFDITGKLLFSSQKIGTSELEISSIQSGAQILLVRTTLDNGSTITKKVIF